MFVRSKGTGAGVIRFNRCGASRVCDCLYRPGFRLPAHIARPRVGARRSCRVRRRRPDDHGRGPGIPAGDRVGRRAAGWPCRPPHPLESGQRARRSDVRRQPRPPRCRAVFGARLVHPAPVRVRRGRPGRPGRRRGDRPRERTDGAARAAGLPDDPSGDRRCTRTRARARLPGYLRRDRHDRQDDHARLDLLHDGRPVARGPNRDPGAERVRRDGAHHEAGRPGDGSGRFQGRGRGTQRHQDERHVEGDR